MSTLTTRLRDIESQLRVGAEEFQQQIQATLLSAEDLAEVPVTTTTVAVAPAASALRLRDFVPRSEFGTSRR